MTADPGRPLSILLLTDVFPPHSGGSGWSTFYLGKALHERGHKVSFMRPVFGETVARPRRRVVEYGGMHVDEILISPAPGYLRRVGLHRAYEERSARAALARAAVARASRGGCDVLHGGHAISGVAASRAALRLRKRGKRVVSVATLRDYWPLCPSSTRLFTAPNGEHAECPQCHKLRAYLGCVSRAGLKDRALGLARWAATRRAAAELNRCDAVIAVSHYVRGELAGSGRIDPSRLVTIPNLVDLPSAERALAGEWTLHDISPGEKFLLFVGKLDANKGAQMLPSLVSEAGVNLTVVIAGSGPLRASVAAEATAKGLDFRFYDWLDNDAVLLLMSRARVLLFPSAWQEPLSRVLLEGLAAGAAIVALDTGGTADAVVPGVSGWLASNRQDMIRGIREVVANQELNHSLREGARRTARDKFSAPVVSSEVEALYRRLLAQGAAT